MVVDPLPRSGLGTGIASSALIHHGLSTTIVELDPAVYEAAQKYFGLSTPEPEKVFLRDARSWVHRRREQLEGSGESNVDEQNAGGIELFDVVVHDCFSGGGVPGHMFTLSMWEDLKAIMNPTGVVAVVGVNIDVQLARSSCFYAPELRGQVGLRLLSRHCDHSKQGIRTMPRFPRLLGDVV